MGHLSRLKPLWIGALGGLLVACSTVAGWWEPEQVSAWRRTASELRGLPFERRVPFSWVEQDDVPGIVRAEINASFPPGTVAAYRDAWAAMGAWPADLDLLDAVEQLNRDEVIGLYSLRRKRMFIVGRYEDAAADDPIVVHELVHALQDQHFGPVLELMAGLRRNDDVAAAMAAAVEGDASLTMFAATGREAGLKRNVASAKQFRALIWLDAQGRSGRDSIVPALLRESLVFPYAHGAVIAARAYERAGNRGLDALLRDPPLATVRVLDPERASDPVEFLAWPRDALRQRLDARGCRAGADNVAGAFGIDVLIRDHGAVDVESVATRWSGDRFVHVRCGERDELVWLVRFSRPAAARAFAGLYRAIAPSVSQRGSLADPPAVYVRDRSALVVSPGLADLNAFWFDPEIRSFETFSDWRAGDCFPETPCPP